MKLLGKVLIGGLIGYFVLWILLHNKITGTILLGAMAIGLQYPAVHLTGYICTKMEIGDFVERHKIIGYFIVLIIWGLVCLVLYAIAVWIVMTLF